MKSKKIRLLPSLFVTYLRAFGKVEESESDAACFTSLLSKIQAFLNAPVYGLTGG